MTTFQQHKEVFRVSVFGGVGYRNHQRLGANTVRYAVGVRSQDGMLLAGTASLQHDTVDVREDLDHDPRLAKVIKTVADQLAEPLVQ